MATRDYTATSSPDVRSVKDSRITEPLRKNAHDAFGTVEDSTDADGEKDPDGIIRGEALTAGTGTPPTKPTRPSTRL